jgi:hypothetical protein
VLVSLSLYMVWAKKNLRSFFCVKLIATCEWQPAQFLFEKLMKLMPGFT